PAEKPQQPELKNSIYVDAFETVLETVISNESHLFSPQEHEFFAAYKNMDYESRYLFVRLFLRKRGQWFRINKLAYHNDISNVPAAILGLFPEFAQDQDCITTLDEALSLLSLDELKYLAKEAKCRGTTKEQIKASLSSAGKSQCALINRGQLKLSFNTMGKIQRQDDNWVKKILNRTGPCIRLREDPILVLHRVHLVFFRTTEYNEKSLTTLILSRISKRNFPEYIVFRTNNVFSSRQALLDYEASIKLEARVEELFENRTPTKQTLGQIHEIFESIYPRWKQLVKETVEDENDPSKYYLRRFTEGWVFTGLVHRGSYVLSRFRDYSKEHEVLTALLSQRLFRRGKRGEWRTRLSLIEERHMGKEKSWLGKSLLTCELGLQDPDTHIIYHNALQKRICRLERNLNIPKREQHVFEHVKLKRARARTMVGVRISEKEIGRKSVWRGDDGAECSVEKLCLSIYESEGWRGYHSENGVITSLFALLFWDILFTPLPGVFETEFQTAPMDLTSDAFYPSRFSEINSRLVHIENGGAEGLIREVYDREKVRETWCVGLQWRYAVEELVQIAECIGTYALSQICKVFAEEYGHRASGMPDLWFVTIVKPTHTKSLESGEERMLIF
ncbi:Fanconi-associated nuclease 1, partial [Neolecta irregularis DAH-3]